MMPKPNKLPISQLPMLASMVTGILENTESQKQQFLEAVDKPYVLDDAIVQRAQLLYRNQLDDIRLYQDQAKHWLEDKLTEAQQDIIKKMQVQIDQIRDSSQTILVLLSEIEKGTINRIMAMSDEEVGIYYLQDQAKQRKKKGKKKSKANMQQHKKSRSTDTNEPSHQHRRIAKKIHEWVLSIQKQGGGSEELLMNMIDYMPSFKKIMDTATPQQIDRLCELYIGFYQFALLLEDLARGIQSGDIEIPKN